MINYILFLLLLCIGSTLYWNGSVITDKNGKATVSFYTSDLPGTYVVSIHGITSNGDTIEKIISFTVK